MEALEKRLLRYWRKDFGGTGAKIIEVTEKKLQSYWKNIIEVLETKIMGVLEKRLWRYWRKDYEGTGEKMDGP